MQDLVTQATQRPSTGQSRHSNTSFGKEQHTLSHVLEGDSIHEALLHSHMLRSRCTIINGRAGLLRVKKLEHQNGECGQHKPETPQVAHSNPDPLPAMLQALV